MNKELDFVVAGVICLDITPQFLSLPTNHIEDILIPSKTILMGKADIHCGGTVSNTGLALSHYGHKVGFMGRLGNDSFGQIIREQYSTYSYFDYLNNTNTPDTSYAIAIAPPGIDRIFLYHPGCNDDFSSNDLNFDIISKSRIFHFGYPQALKKMYENDGQYFIDILKKIKQLGVVTSVDTCSIDPHSSSGSANWTKILKNSIPYIDFFLPSLEELCYMVDYPKYLYLLKHSNGKDFTNLLSLSDIEDLAQKVISMGAKILMIKCGAKGIYFASGIQENLKSIENELGFCLSSWANQTLIVPAFKPKTILSATGAGDVCIATFLSAMIRRFPLKTCLQLAAMAGSKCCESYDALGALPTFDTLLQFLDSKWDRNIFN